MRGAAVVTGGMVFTLAGCGFFGANGGDEPARSVKASLTVTSSAFNNGSPVPSGFSCRGANMSPPLSWSGVPADARSLALVVADPDAPGGTYFHWVVLDIDPGATSVAQDAVPTGGRQAKNSAGHARYDGPCPPSGTHHYRFTVYLLRSPTTLPDGVDLDRALAAVEAKAVARGTLTGTFSLPR